MTKLIKNELIKIFKRKNIWILIFISILYVIGYNILNPNQNAKILENQTDDKDIILLESAINNNVNNTHINVELKTDLDYSKLYNRYSRNSWQRYALNLEETFHSLDGNYNESNESIKYYISIINNFELSKNTNINDEKYFIAKERYLEYLDTLESNNWKDYVLLKIKYLNLKKDLIYDSKELDIINTNIETLQMRLSYNIIYNNNILNQYLEQYKINCLLLSNYQNTHNLNKSIIQDYEAKIALIKYAIENNISNDISPENYLLILDNNVDARNSFVRFFKHFDIIIIFINIYISSIILTEELHTGTIKNLLIKPFSRKKILLSKILSCIIITLIVIMFMIFIQFIVGGIIFGFDSYNLHYIAFDYIKHEIITMNLFSYLFILCLMKLPMFLFITLFCIFIGIVSINTQFTVIVSLLFYMISSYIITNLSTNSSISFITKFFISNNWDFSNYIFGHVSSINGVNLIFSIIVYIFYTFALFKILLNTFEKKDINSN